nr:hypothetical protein [candidate division Zixibacteria bacterium]
MPFCPRCRYEYREGIIKCPDCGEKLVDSLPVESKSDSDYENDLDDYPDYYEWIPLASLSSQYYAEMFIETLRAKGIPAVLKSSLGHFGVTGQMGLSSYRPVGGAYTIMVESRYIADADREGQVMFGEDWPKYRLVELS